MFKKLAIRASSKASKASKSPQVETYSFGSPYEYTKLELSSSDIRVLELLPAESFQDPLSGRLRTLSLDSEPEFEALSYVWGDQSVQCPLHIGDTTLKIGEPLAIALRHIRNKHQIRVLWVDSVCICQEDLDEKNHQVRRMSDIYSKARKVIAWLGPLSPKLGLAMAWFSTSLFHDLRDPKMQHSLVEFYSLPWWSRMWVVQEVVAANNEPLVMCGNICVDWTWIMATMAMLSHDLSEAENRFNLKIDLDSLRRFALLKGHIPMTQGQTEPNDLASLLVATENRKATQRPDHVYAILGLCTESASLNPGIDYKKSTSLVFQEATVAIFKSQSCLLWLLFAPGGNDTTLPSWCPDFSMNCWGTNARKQRWIEADDIHARYVRSRASTGRNCTMLEHDPSMGTIKVLGVFFGRIDGRETFPGAMRASIDSGEFDLLKERKRRKVLEDNSIRVLSGSYLIARMIEASLEVRLGREEAHRRLASGEMWKVFTAGVTWTELLGPPSRSPVQDDATAYGQFGMLEKLAQVHDKKRKHEFRQWSHLLPAGSPNTAATWTAASTAAYRSSGRCFFTTENYFYGLAGQAVEEQDLVCILFGCSYPAVLRPRPDGSLKLVTFAYIPDIMEGEFVVDKPDLVGDEFLLR